MLRNAWGGGGVMLTLLALAHMVHATQRMGCGWGGGVMMLTFCTFTPGGCYARHGVGLFNVPRRRAGKATLQVNTGAIDGWGRRSQDSIPPSLHTLLGNGEVNPKIFQCVQRYAWRWEHTGTDLMAETGQQAHKMRFGA